MSSSLIQSLRSWLPPALDLLLRPYLGRAIHFRGRYATWSQAATASDGYDSATIMTRVTDAARKVRDGHALAERDGVLLTQPQFSFPVLAGLLRAAQRHQRTGLRVLDFGGALGSSYQQVCAFLGADRIEHWAVVEQPELVRLGQAEFTQGGLEFYANISEAQASGPSDVALCSSVLQYLQDPWSVIDELRKLGIPDLVIDRTPVYDGSQDILTVQRIPRRIYRASYPCRIYAATKMRKRLQRDYHCVAEFVSSDGSSRLGRTRFDFRGFILQGR